MEQMVNISWAEELSFYIQENWCPYILKYIFPFVNVETIFFSLLHDKFRREEASNILFMVC